MSDQDRSLGGYDPEAGLSPRQAAAVHKLPVPSLLRSLLSEHLDPGYAAAAAAKAAAPPGNGNRLRAAGWLWQAFAALLIAAVFAAAVAQARSVAPGVSAAQHVLAGSVRSAEGATDDLNRRRDDLAGQVDDIQRRQLRDGAEGRQLLGALDALTLAGATTAVIGPGLTVTVADPNVGVDLSDVSKQRVPGSRQVILDRDLQLVVNSLWACGAEAVSVGGIRIGPNVTIRQAGGAILVDNHPISSPYSIVAIGPPNSMREDFEHSSGLVRMRLLETSYGVGVNVSAGDGLTVPAGAARDIKFAKRIGP
ncbi:DUF881 domain-containing protein [Mycolicibacterium komossense]|uniref:DUF881 domain-containing protein n=1 Tax=Mycolicibacterium komossense TaxID=1779 RepID=A0ABT3CIK8_9MYCO|nr:DUF881 domain-containing protein [Mycolicibacterium komossense]MCV7229313.1 DUF881 domain-containing protein [Mycolicibacterium komossense]